MHKYFLLKKQIKHLSSENISLKQNKTSKIDLALKIIFPLVALIISVTSLKLSYDVYDSNIEPNIISYINSVHLLERKASDAYSLVIFNDGINTVYDIRIRYYYVNYNQTNNDFSVPSFMFRDWKTFEKIEPNDSIIIPIDSNNVKQAFNESKMFRPVNEKINPLFPIISYSIKYRRHPDNRQFRINTSGIILLNTANNSPTMGDIKYSSMYHLYNFDSLIFRLDSVLNRYTSL